MFSRNKKGFTLIELLIVIVIIGILAGVVLSVLNPAKAQRKSAESVLKATTEKLCLGLFSCAATESSAANCNAFVDISAATSETQYNGNPLNSAYTISASDPVTITGQLPNSGPGAAGICKYTCSYTFTSGAVVNLTKGAAAGEVCLID